MYKFWGIPYFGWLAGCLLIAIAYLIFVPKAAHSPHASLAERVIIRYAHSMVWLLLALACIAANAQWQVVAKAIALAAGVIYLIFMITFLKTGAKDKTEKASHQHQPRAITSVPKRKPIP